MYFAGIDIGSTMTKVVIYGDTVLATVIGPTGAEHRKTANVVMKDALSQLDLSIDDITFVVATGYGRMNVPFADKQITEITCHGKAIVSLIPSAKTAIDIGGQDCKGLQVTQGKVTNFVMNDKCAAGTGRFLEVIAEAVGMKIEDIGNISLKARNVPMISNTCAVFAEREVISLLANGTMIEDILAGIHDAIATRVYMMVQRIKIEKDVVITGGGAKNVGLVKALEDKIGFRVIVPPEPLITGALGAALVGKEEVMKAAQKGLSIDRAERRLQEITFFG
jgi:predicted CoA-substrate-specific enzyme activase